MIETLRSDMIDAFKTYAKKQPGIREFEWDFYCKCRENFLKEHARLNFKTYTPLKLTVEKIARYDGN